MPMVSTNRQVPSTVRPRSALVTATTHGWSDASDNHHLRAVDVLSNEELHTTDHVLVETWRLLAHRVSPRKADEFWERALLGGVVLDNVTAADLGKAWLIRQGFPDQAFSIVDCTSFVVMERLGLMRVASFDDDFAIYRFGPGSTRAFEVVR